MEQYRGTTFLSVRRGNQVALGGGQVTLGNIINKASARMLRRLEAMLAAADRECSLVITGNGDVLEPELGIIAIGSGGPYAQSAARALLENTDLAVADSVKKSLAIAGDICIYTNQNHLIETLN